MAIAAATIWEVRTGGAETNGGGYSSGGTDYSQQTADAIEAEVKELVMTAYRRANEFIKAALPAAQKAGVTLCVENVWNKFLLSPIEMRWFLDELRHESVGSYFDVGNALLVGYPEDWIGTLGKRIRRVHFKDFRRNVGTIDGFCDLLSGDVNWPAVMQALRKTGYNGWVAGEMIPPVPFYKHCPEVLIHNTSRAMDAIFALEK
jgi:hexulose-6-phosphate isomerase